MDLIQQLKTPDFITGFAESRIGGRSENQDSYGYSDTPYGFVVTVCDGMGGGPGGKTASSIAVSEIISGIKEGNSDDTATNIVIKAIRRANLAIIEAGNITPALKGMGSTCTVLLISEESAIVAHVGDSRVYQLRGKNKVFRTFDHSMVFDLVKQKVITEEQARLSAQSNVITRALGIKSDIEVDVTELPYDTGDRFLLTTDGIHGSVSEIELIEMASDKKHALGIVTDEIATTIDGKGRNEGGGHDNLTIAIIETKINSKLRSKMNTKLKFTLIGLIAICIVSIAFNVILCSRKASTSTGVQLTENMNSGTDSLKIVELRDSTKNLLSKLQAFSDNQTDKSTEIKQLSDKIQKVETDLRDAKKELNNANANNKLYLDEIHRLIKEIDYAVNNNRPAKQIKIKNEYREKK